MLKMYRITNDRQEYWETWDAGDGSHTVHWGILGTNGESKSVKPTLFGKALNLVQKEIDAKIEEGFSPIDEDAHAVLLIEYSVDEMGDENDLSKRHQLEERMNEFLGWTGLGACDGGSIGSGTMEVCCFVVDFQCGKLAIETNLADTKFANFTRIYNENA